jgi:hypothetical protein
VKGTDDEFTSRAEYRYASGGAPVVREGKSVVYTGHQWRGRSSSRIRAERIRQCVARSDVGRTGWQEMSGRWFRGGYDEFGIDVDGACDYGARHDHGVLPRAAQAWCARRGSDRVRREPAESDGTASARLRPGFSVTRIVRTGPDEIVAVSTSNTARASAAVTGSLP